MMMRRLLLPVLVVVSCLVLLSASAWAEEGLTVGGVNYTRGTISLSAQGYPREVSRLDLRTSMGAGLQSLEVPEGSSVTSFAPYRLADTTGFEVRGFDSSGAAVWIATATCDPARWRPDPPKLATKREEVVGAEWDVHGSAGRPVAQIKAYCSQSERTSTVRATSGDEGEFEAEDLPVPFGRGSFKLRAVNGFGSSNPVRIRVYNLGSAVPNKHRYVLVSKGTFWMYYVHDDKVVKRWPIAIGMPWTPTPTGTFSLGSAQHSSGPWGPLRRPLRRSRGGHLYGTGYYIHGHAPGACWSIGQAASHGCVRMHNASIREFTRMVPSGTAVKIR